MEVLLRKLKKEEVILSYLSNTQYLYKVDFSLILMEQNGIERHIKYIRKEIDDTGDDVDHIKDEVVDTGKDVDHIKDEVIDTGKDVDEIKLEVFDTGKDIDEIKEDLEEIKEDIDEIIKKKSVFSGLKNLPEKFGFDDLAQQIIGAVIVSAPFAVTEEVWGLAKNLVIWQLLMIFIITIIFDVLLFYFTKYQRMKAQKIANFIPLRIVSIVIVTYCVSAFMLTILGVLGNKVPSLVWGSKLVILVGLFANIGAGTADLIR